MNERNVKIRPMQAEYFDAVVGIDEKIPKATRPYFKQGAFTEQDICRQND